MDEPQAATPEPRPCATPHSAPLAWLKHAAALAPAQPQGPDPDQNPLRAAIELVLASPDALAEVIGRAPPEAFAPVLAEDEPGTSRRRADGWTGDRMATFLETLADTGIVDQASRAAGMHRSGAYALRSRNAVFNAAWAAAETLARPQLSDGLLERGINGTVEHYYRDGVLVGERRHYESWLALAVLRRLDKQAEQDRADDNLSARIAGGWQDALDALREGGTAAVPRLLQPELDKLDIPPTPPGYDPSENVWKSDSGLWMTSFPPPPGFDGHESARWDGFNAYERACTPEEVEMIETHRVIAEAEELAEATAYAEAERDAWFATLKRAPAGGQRA